MDAIVALNLANRDDNPFYFKHDNVHVYKRNMELNKKKKKKRKDGRTRILVFKL